MNFKSKPKRGAEFIVIDTKARVWLDRIQENGRYFCRTTPASQIDAEFEVFKQSELKPVTKVNAPINKVSNTRKVENRIYSTLRKVFLDNHPVCQIRRPGCRVKSSEVHHKKGRIGKLFLDVRFWLAACDRCHKWAEKNPEAAKEAGFSLDRL